MLFNGLLQMNGRARIVGSPVHSPLYTLIVMDLSDHSRLEVPSIVFQPRDKPVGYFNTQGINPDVIVPSRFDLYTEATDPLLARAIELLQAK